MIRELAVVVPARNEQRRIGACLHALSRSRERLARSRPDIRVRLIVVLDRCSDATATVAAHHGTATVPVTAGCVGIARATGCAAALAAASSRPEQIWLAATDADSVVPPDWMTGMVDSAESGTDLVIGTVLPGPGLPHEVERRWRAAHVARDGHPHVHGANLGVRADVYRAAGGWPAIATGEDQLLVERALAVGARAVRTCSRPVRTSTRYTGRAPRGFSSYLRGLAAALDEVSQTPPPG